MPVVASDFDLRDTPEDKLPYDPKQIGAAKPQVPPAELKQEENVPTPTQPRRPPTATRQQEPAVGVDASGQQHLNLRG
jgi:hypothetical protein